MKRIWKLNADARISCFTWYQYSSWFIRFYCKGQHIYCFLPFGFINVIIFVVDSFGSYSTFFGADLEYPNSLRQDRINWSRLTYFNFEPNLKLWWRRARDFDGSRNLITWSFCLRHHFHHHIQYEKFLENYSLLVYQ